MMKGYNKCAAIFFIAVASISPLHAAWQPLNDGFTEFNLNQLQLLPTNQSRFIYAATDFGGLYQIYKDGSFKEIGKEVFEGERINSIAIDSQHENILYVATDSKGVLRSTDNGATWKAINNGLKIVPEGFATISQVYVNPIQSNELYALDPYFGLFHSINNGKQWNQLKNPEYRNPDILVQAQISPVNSKNIILESWFNNYLTLDGGINWHGLSYQMPYHYSFSAISSNQLYARKDNQFLTSPDLGQSWQVLYNFPENTKIKAYVVNKNNEQEMLLASDAGMMYSTNGGEEWKNINNATFTHSFTQLYQDAKNPTSFYATALQDNNSIYFSENSGNDWMPINVAITTPNIVSLAIDPHNSQIKYAGTFSQGLWIMRDGHTWQRSSLPVTNQEEVTQVIVDPINSQNILALTNKPGGLEYNIYYSRDAGNTWQLASPAVSRDFMPTYLAYNLQNTNEVYASGALNLLFKSQDGGATWFPVKTEENYDFFYAKTLAINPSNPNEILSGWDQEGSNSNLIHQSQDGGKTWKAISIFHDNVDRAIAVTSIAFDAMHLGTIYVLANIEYDHPGAEGCLFKSTDDGKTWQQVGNGLPRIPINADNMQSLVINPANPNDIYIAFSAAEFFDEEIDSYGNAGVYVSHDGGLNFTHMKGLNNNFVRALLINDGYLYAATIGSGVWKEKLNN